jgi:hypothetical protein
MELPFINQSLYFVGARLAAVWLPHQGVRRTGVLGRFGARGAGQAQSVDARQTYRVTGGRAAERKSQHPRGAEASVC